MTPRAGRTCIITVVLTLVMALVLAGPAHAGWTSVDRLRDVGPVPRADVRLTYGLGVYINLTGAEIATLAAVPVVALGATSIAVCSGAAAVPAGAARVMAVVCTAAGAPTLKAIVTQLSRLYRTSSFRTAGCYQVRLVPTVSSARLVSPRLCGKVVR